MTISICQSGGARIVMRLARPRMPDVRADTPGALSLLLDMLDSVLERR